MAIKLDCIEPEFKQQLELLLADCRNSGVEMRPYFGLRSLEDQAIFWRQSRAIEEINAASTRLRSSGAPYLADVLDSIGPRHGEHVTNALPGFSWHQWGEACDCFWALNGKAEWSSTELADGINGYRIYASKAKAFGLDAGGLWSSFKDWPHVQYRKEASPLAAGMSVKEINDAMVEKFSKKKN